MFWGEFQVKFIKVTQGKLVDVFSKVLTEEEYVVLSQVLCQGELGVILSQFLFQAVLRIGVGFFKAVIKMMRSGMIVMFFSMEVDRRESLVVICGFIFSFGRLQFSKVRVFSVGVWEGFVIGWFIRFLEGMGDGVGIMGLFCLSVVFVGVFFIRWVIIIIYQYFLVVVLDFILLREMGFSRDFFLQLYLNLEVSEENVCFYLVVFELVLDFNLVANDTGFNLFRLFYLQFFFSVWQSFIVNGVGSSISQLLVVSGIVLSFYNLYVVSRVVLRSWTSSGQGRVVSGQFFSIVGNGRVNQFYQCVIVYGGFVCWCQFFGVGRVFFSVYRFLMVKGL